MASKNIKGITIKIGGDTTELTKALKDVNNVIQKSNTELKSLNQALKLDPKNTELLAQKQEVLQNSIKATTDRLNTLKEAQKQMGSYNSLTEAQKESYRALSVEISKNESSLQSMNKELKETGKVNLESLRNGLAKVGSVALSVAEALAKVAAAVAGALAGLVAAGVKSYGELEKAQKGAERLYGDSFSIVQENASKAYKTMGLSASEYYDQVNTYAVGLKESLGGDSEAAANLSNNILKAQADIVAATGADADAVQNAFAAVMRGNYTMIDNLRLGIKGSKEGMQEVVNKVNEWREANGNTSKLVMGNYADMQQALVEYTQMVGVAGTAEQQMSSTISGSLSQMKAAFDNFINGSGSAEDLAGTITTFLTNIGNAISKLAPSILSGIVQLIQTLLPQVVSMITELLPQLISAVSNLIDSLLNSLKGNTGKIGDTIGSLLQDVIKFITDNIPKIIEIALLIVESLAKGLAKALPTLLTSVIEMLANVITTILSHLPEIIKCALEIILALAKGLVEALPKLIEAIPKIITALVQAILNPEMLAKIIESAVQLVLTLAVGIVEAIPKLIEAIPTLIESLVTALLSPEMLVKVIEASIELVVNLAKGLIEAIPKLIMAIPKIIIALVKALVNPEMLMKVIEAGVKLIVTLGSALVENIPKLINEVPKIISSLFNKLKDLITKTDWGKIGSDIIKGICEGFGRIGNYISKKVNEVKDAITSKFKSIFGIHSPSKLMADTIGYNITAGIGEGIEEGIPDALSDAQKAMKRLNAGIESSVNPTINPSITYETNYEMMAKAVKEALNDMEVVLDDDKVGKFVVKTITNEVYS